MTDPEDWVFRDANRFRPISNEPLYRSHSSADFGQNGSVSENKVATPRLPLQPLNDQTTAELDAILAAVDAGKLSVSCAYPEGLAGLQIVVERYQKIP